MRDAMLAHADAEWNAAEHPGVGNAQKAKEASQWLWLMPALLMRKTGVRRGALDEQSTPNKQAEDSFAQNARQRVQKAESGQWDELLREYVKEQSTPMPTALAVEGDLPLQTGTDEE
eukprot:4608823-Karenia_brevis.AAC.1